MQNQLLKIWEHSNVKNLNPYYLENKKKILLISIISSLIFLLYAASLKDIYESKALLASSNSSSSNSSLNRFAGVASLAGFNLPSDSESNKLLIGLERLKSIDFFATVKCPLIAACSDTDQWNFENYKIFWGVR